MNQLIRVTIDDSAIPPASAEVIQDRKVAIRDLIEENMDLPGRDGQPAPFGPQHAAAGDPRWPAGLRHFDRRRRQGSRIPPVAGPFRQVVKDYFRICASYYDAVKTMSPAQIEAIDMARRGIHNEGARTLQESAGR